MANLKEIRNRIASVSSTKQITSAMKMVSAAKLRKSQSAIQKLRPYSLQMSEIVAKLGSSDNADIPYARKNKNEKNILLISLTSNKGLCSTFNSSIIKLTINRINFYKQEGKNVYLKSFGKRGDSHFCNIKGINYLGSEDNVWDNLDFSSVSSIATNIMNDFVSEKYDKVEIIYNVFKNAATQYPVYENFLPISFSDSEKTESNTSIDYIFQPNKNDILQNVVPQALHTQLYKCFLDSFTSEHGARMSSMSKATDNAQELLKELTLTYNKIRQASITNEIIEICSGANALE